MNTIVDRSGITDRVRTIIVEKLGVDATMLADKASFTGDLGLDSLDVLETIMAMEKEFSINIPDEDAERLITVGSVIDYITQKCAR
jgi:acyl carrier protein